MHLGPDATIPTSLFTQKRGGTPRLRRKLETGEPVKILAYGTSMTVDGMYLAALEPSVRAAFPHANVVLHREGREGFDTAMAAFDTQSVAVQAPDVVLLEFSINDHDPISAPLIVPALLGIMGQIRDVQPDCEFVFVFLARSIDIVHTNLTALRIHDAFADVHDLPSINLASLSNALVASGAATYEPDAGHSLTHDGTHHTPFAATAIGVPFANAMVEVIASNADLPERTPPRRQLNDMVQAMVDRLGGTIDGALTTTFTFDGETLCALMKGKYSLKDYAWLSPVVVTLSEAKRFSAADVFYRARRASAGPFLAGGQWGIGEPQNVTNGFYYGEPLLVSLQHGSSIRFTLSGSFFCVVGLSNGTARITIDGVLTGIPCVKLLVKERQSFWPIAITQGLRDEPHEILLEFDGTMTALSDIYYVTAPSVGR